MKHFLLIIIVIFCLSLGIYFTWTAKAGDFGNAEVEITISNIHSSPRIGENWTVSFETTGRANLTITPNDQATINDLDFVSLTCDGEERTPQILASDIIFYPNWQCDGTGEVIHLVNVARPHILKFQFGDQVGYAYNSPDDTGATYPETATTEAVSPEDDADWDNPDNIKADDGNTASIYFYSYIYSYRLKATNFGFSLPAGATIDGIKVEIERESSQADSIKDIRVQLLDADGNLVGDNNADTETEWPTSMTVKSYGGAVDTWNATPTKEMVEDADFGVVLSIYNYFFMATIPRVDFIRITIYYAPTPPLQGSEQTFTVNNVAPVVSAVKLNDDGPMTLTNAYGDSPNTTDIDVTGTVTDDNGCEDIVEVDTLADVFTTDIAHEACDENANDNNNYCYALVDCSLSGCGASPDLDVVATCKVSFLYHADPTVANTPKDTDLWTAFLKSKDETADATPVEAGTKVEMNDFVALSVTDTIAYGSLAVGDISDGTNLLQTATVTAKGNTGLDVKLYGTDMTSSGTLLYEYYNTGDSTGIYFRSNWWRGQTFTPDEAHKITSVKLKLYRVGSPGEITVSIRATSGSLPTGGDLCSGTFDGDTLTTNTNGEWVEITLGAGYELEAEIEYAIVVRALDGSDGNEGRWRAEFGGSPMYPDGQYVYSNDSGVNFSDSPDYEFMFEEWGSPSSPTIVVGAQKYAATAVTYGTATALGTGPPGVEHDLNCQKNTGSGDPKTKDVEWGLQIPDETPTGEYSGTNTFVGLMTETGEW